MRWVGHVTRMGDRRGTYRVFVGFWWGDMTERGHVEDIVVCQKVKQTRYRPGVSQRVSRNLRSPDFMTTAQDGGKVVSLTKQPPLTLGNTPT